MSTRIAFCGNDCKACPRGAATRSGDPRRLTEVAELWHRAGWRDRVVSPEEISCSGCSGELECRYGIAACAEPRGVASCGGCAALAGCDRLASCLERSERVAATLQRRLQADLYRALERAFFRKRENLAWDRRRALSSPGPDARAELRPEPWWKEAVFYQIYPRSFQDSNGDGIGDLPGILSRLGYLQALGVDALWLSPIYPSPQKDFGYDVSDYTSVDPIYGSLDDFRRLLDEAHSRGLRLLLDQVLNHTSDQHPWFLESRSSRDNARADWYIWADGAPEQPPNNWRSFFGGSAWSWDPVRRQHYLHLFTPEQPDLNWRNADVRQALLQVLRFWLELGVDGFRLDVVNLYFKDAGLRDNPLRGGPPGSPFEFHDYHQVFMRDRPETLLAVEELQRVVEEYPARVTVGEVTSELGLTQYLEYTKPARLNLAFNFDFKHVSAFDALAFGEQVQLCETFFRDVAWPSYVLGNHDTPRVISRLCLGESSAARARVLATLLLTVRGTPFIYYGEELGMEEVDLPRALVLDPVGKNLWPLKKGRDGCRTPMQWDSSAHAGFSTSPPWLPVHPDHGQINVAAEEQDPGSLLHFYRRLLQTRRSSAALRSGQLRFVRPPDGRALAYLRERGAERVLVVLSFSEARASLELPAELGEAPWRVLFASQRPEGEVPSASLRPIELEPYEILVLAAMV